MTQLNRIVCPIDFSDCSRHALDHAVAIARCYESELTALHVNVTHRSGVRPAAFRHLSTHQFERSLHLLQKRRRGVDDEAPRM